MVKQLIYSPRSQVKIPFLYGDGSDGSLTPASLGVWEPSKLQRYTLCTLPSDTTVGTAGAFPYIVYCSQKFTNYGNLQMKGTNASGTTAGAGPDGEEDGSGGNGGAGTTSNAVGGNAQSSIYMIGSPGGGNGGTAGANAGGQNSYNQLFTSTFVNKETCKQFNIAGLLQYLSTTTALPIKGGGGGGGGGNATGAAVSSGGGGGGGGLLIICAPIIENFGTINLNGGNGANATGTGNGGGGGAGGGGTCILIGEKITVGSITANGGTAGNGIGTGNAGASAPAGNIIQVLAS